MAGVRNCQAVGLKVGLRFTVSRLNYQEVPAIFDLVEEYNIPRICFYHLVYAGRGTKLVEEALSHKQTRETGWTSSAPAPANSSTPAARWRC